MDTEPDVFTRAKLGAVTLRNRIIKDPTFEASTPVANFRIDKAMRRALFAGLDLINRIRAGAVPGSVRSAGTHCNNCMATIYGHTRCGVTAAPRSLPVLGG